MINAPFGFSISKFYFRYFSDTILIRDLKHFLTLKMLDPSANVSLLTIMVFPVDINYGRIL